MRVLLVASECTPYAKVGGLGDVISGLAQELSAQGVAVDIVLPLYAHLLSAPLLHYPIADSEGNAFEVLFEHTSYSAKLFYIHFSGSPIRLFLIQHDIFLSNGGIYLSRGGFAEHDDEIARFMFFSKAVYTLIMRGVFCYDVIHAHDYHTSFLLYLLRHHRFEIKSVTTVLTLHTTANQGIVQTPLLCSEIGNGGPYNLLALGIASADRVVPVSVTFCRELLSGRHCFGLESVVSAFSDKFFGIVNGLDTEFFNPRTDAFISFPYDVHSFSENKVKNKEALLSELSCPASVRARDIFFVGFVGRIVAQKNIALLCDSIRAVFLHGDLAHNFVFVFLGVGDVDLECQLAALGHEYPSAFYFINRFDERFAHVLFAASDLFLIPSVFEPCGLTQLIAMRYGALPLATPVGGLVDTIIGEGDKQTGFFLDNATVDCVSSTLLRLYSDFRDSYSMWSQLVARAMEQDFSWRQPARQYIVLYES